MGPMIQRFGLAPASIPTARLGIQGSDQRLRHLIFVPTGLLGLLPLHLAWRVEAGRERYVLDDFVVTYAPSAYTLGIARDRAVETKRQAHRLLAVINPNSDLPFSLVEAQLLVGHFPDGGTSTLLRDKEATQEALEQALPGRTYLHFACHGSFKCLILAQGNPLELREVLNLNFNCVRLVTLSACETGLIELWPVPDEVVGLSTGFLQAGAAGVVSTLWAVTDVSTSLLMGEFYRRHLVKGDAIADALRGAQLWLREATASQLELAEYYERFCASRDRPNSVANRNKRYWEKHPNEKPFAEPYYWAPFVFTGY